MKALEANFINTQKYKMAMPDHTLRTDQSNNICLVGNRRTYGGSDFDEDSAAVFSSKYPLKCVHLRGSQSLN